MKISDYLSQVFSIRLTRIATEHSYRSTLQSFVSSFNDNVVVTNEPRRQACGAPDLIVQRGETPIGYIETKDIGTDVENPKALDAEQRNRYLESLDNMIFTDYFNFVFYRSGCLVANIKLAAVENEKLIVYKNRYLEFESSLRGFLDYSGQTIKTADALAQMMARKASMMKSIIAKALSDKDTNNTLFGQYRAFRRVLIHDLDLDRFADMYSQTITYGLFVARINDTSHDSFSRQEARDLVPKNNPFLRSLFDYFSGAQLDDRITWIVDDIADMMRAADFKSILEEYRKDPRVADPFIHFYETFLSHYNPTQRKLKGVYYTPSPIVKFIVKSVDDILQTELGVSKGLASEDKVTIQLQDKGKPDRRSSTGYKSIEVDFPRVQVLDPAVGTGTFLCEVVRQVYEKFSGQEGLWPDYVNNNLLPRLNGFELLVAPYTVSHLRIGMLLEETGISKSDIVSRIRVYLSNSLEDADPDTESLLAAWLSDEADEANRIKSTIPVMAILGNPPYSISSSNKNKWIRSLINDYKKGLNETKINLDDDYIKFIRCAQHYLDKVPEGVLAFISNNSYVDGITHRQMRKHLLGSFNKVYILDLHGNANKQEKGLDGQKDENVFDIKQGVAIGVFIKSRKSESEILHYDVYGTRAEKYDFLSKNCLGTIPWESVSPDEEYCFFNARKAKDDLYMSFPSVTELFSLYNSGIQTKCDRISVHFNKKTATKVIDDFLSLDIESLNDEYKFLKDMKVWSIDEAILDIKKNNPSIIKEQYRPFDYRYAIYTGSKGIMARPRSTVSSHLVNKDNLALCMMRQVFQDREFSHVLVTKHMIDERTMYSNRGGTYIFPLYQYKIVEGREQKISSIPERIISIFRKCYGCSSDAVGIIDSNLLSQRILYYCYAIMNSPQYRSRYRPFLTYDFPRIPLPISSSTFNALADYGERLVSLHTFGTMDIKPITTFSVVGSMQVTNIKYTGDSVFINDKQFFGKVPKVVWDFYIGGYQPAKHWLESRKGLVLSMDDVNHYQSMISVIRNTITIMSEIDVHFIKLIDELGE